MSNVNQARRTTAQVVFNGVDISVYVNSDLISLTYTDNEEDEADDLQIKVLDREKNWLQKWLDTLVSNAAIGSDSSLDGSESSNGTSDSGSSGGGSSGGSGEKNYKVTATSGVNVRTNTTSKGKILGKLPYGTIVTVNKFSDGWAQIRYTGKTAWIKGENLKLVGSSGGGSGSTKKPLGGEKGGFNYDRNSDWSIGDEVIVTGPPQYSSYGLGEPGDPVTDWKGKISRLNLKPEIPYPIHADWLGWFAENQVQRVNGEDKQPAEKGASRGLKISVAIVRENWNADGNDEVLDCGQFELDNVTVDGPPNTVTIKATSLSYTNAIRQTEKSKSWENVTLSQILEFITKKSGMGYMFISSKNPKYTRVEQYRQSDIAFLSRLCHNAGCSLKVTSNIVVIFDQAEFEQNPEIKTIRFGEIDPSLMPEDIPEKVDDATEKAKLALETANEVKRQLEALNVSCITKRDIVIPTTGWVQSDPEEYEGLSVDIPVEGVTGDMIPIVIVPPKQLKVIGERKFCPCVKSDDGYIRLYSKASPPEPINATLVLLITSGGATGDGGSYHLPTASADKLGGVKIGENINVTDDGTISVNSEELVSDIVASDEDAEEVITRYFGKT